MTPVYVAGLMAGMFSELPEEIRLLDAGAGTGSLTAAFVEECCSRSKKPTSIRCTAFELDDVLTPYLEDTLVDCEAVAGTAGVTFKSDLRHTDFIEAAVSALDNGLFGDRSLQFDAAILNPPYRLFPRGPR